MILVDIFPSQLFVTLTGVSLLFALATANGTMAGLSDRLVAATQGRKSALPALIFLSTALIAALGAGNIAATALIAPTALALGPRLGLTPFLTTLLVIGGANAGTMSPLAVTGIVAGKLLEPTMMAGGIKSNFAWDIFLTSFLCIAFVHGSGFLVCGGFSWLRGIRHGHPRPRDQDGALAVRGPLPEAQRHTVAVLGGFAATLVLTAPLVVRQWLLDSGLGYASEPGAIALVAVAALVARRLARLREGLRIMPWKTILLITTMCSLAAALERYGGLTLMAQRLAEYGQGPYLRAWVALAAALLSSVSSSVGVVLPLMLPMVPTLASYGADQAALATAVVLGSHLVDCSPLSSLGALCVGAAPGLSEPERRHLFWILVQWGFVMAPTAALLALIL